MVDTPVSSPLTCMRILNDFGSVSANPWSKDMDPSGFRRRTARLRFLNAGEAIDH